VNVNMEPFEAQILALSGCIHPGMQSQRVACPRVSRLFQVIASRKGYSASQHGQLYPAFLMTCKAKFGNFGYSCSAFIGSVFFSLELPVHIA
jgi:hypothetical protein